MLSSGKNQRLNRGLLLTIVAVQSVCLWVATTELSPTIDEYPHLVAGLEYWQTGSPSLYHVNPPLVRLWATLPLRNRAFESADDAMDFYKGQTARLEFAKGQRFADRNGLEAFSALVVARRMCIPLVVGGTLGVFALALLLSQASSIALAAAALYGLNPIVLGYGPLLGCDLPAASAGIWFLVSLLVPGGHWLKRASVCGILLGIACLTKYTWLIVLPCCLFVVLIHRWLKPNGNANVGSADVEKSDASLLSNLSPWQFILIGCIAWFMVLLCFRFQEVGWPLSRFEFVSHALAGAPPSMERGGSTLATQVPEVGFSGNRFRGSWLGSVPVPLPARMLAGLDQQWQDFDAPRQSYVAGRWQSGGWYSYYLVVLAVKLPLAWTLLLILVGYHACLRAEIMLTCVVPAAIVLVTISLKTNMNEHGRYVWVILPQLAIVAAAGLQVLNRNWRKLGYGGVLLSAASGIGSVPYGLSSCHEFGGWLSAGRPMLAGSNVDWGQGWIAAKRWLDRREDVSQPVAIVRPRWNTLATIGIETQANWPASIESADESILVLVATDELLRLQRERTDAWLMETPLLTVGGTVQLYRLEETEVARLDVLWFK